MNLNWGCGSIQPDGWVNVDNDPEFKTALGEVYSQKDDTFDIIVAHCSLQMVEYNNIETVLAELRRVLKPGGVLRISLPDIVVGIQNYADGNIEWFPNGEDFLDDRFCAWLTWYSTTKTLLTYPALALKLRRAGFGTISKCDYKETKLSESTKIYELDTREGECYFTEAMK